MRANQALIEPLAAESRDAPLVVAHRGDSSNFPENTLPAFRSACELGVCMQEFDVRATRDGHLVCIHDDTLDRTTDSATRIGPGALVAEVTLAEIRALDAGSWRGHRHGGTRVPTLSEALATMLPACIPMIEHKAGAASQYLEALSRQDALHRCVLQSFDWAFVAAARQAAPNLAAALLGPTDQFAQPCDAAITFAQGIGVDVIHWDARSLTCEDVERVHAAGLLVCTYTTDDEVGMVGGAAMGFDAMCTNRPERMVQLRTTNRMRRAHPRPRP